MANQFSVIAGIHNVLCEARLKPGIAIGHGLYLTNDARSIKELQSKTIRSQIGSLEAQFLEQNCKLFVYGRVDLNNPSVTIIQRCAYGISEYVNNVLRTLWLLRDCCYLVEQVYLIEFPDQGGIHANRSIRFTCKADGLTSSVTFSKAELTHAVQDLRGLYFKAGQKDLAPPESPSEDWWRTHESVSEREGSRMARFLGFVYFAQITPDLGLKIAHYVTALEALLSTGSGELRYILSERVALLAERGNRQRRFQTVQKLYDVRSRILHGNPIGKRDLLVDLARRADTICREVAYSVTNDNGLRAAVSNNVVEDVQKFFLAKVFSAN